jgi:hypothetical protein
MFMASSNPAESSSGQLISFYKRDATRTNADRFEPSNAPVDLNFLAKRSELLLHLLLPGPGEVVPTMLKDTHRPSMPL